MATLQVLTGLIIEKIEKVQDYIQIIFSDSTTLTVFNDYVIDSGSILSIEGKTVKFVEESDSSVIILFESGESLFIGLNDDDYNGPEAIVLRQKRNSPIIWN